MIVGEERNWRGLR